MQQAYALLQRLRTAACTMSTAEQQAARQQCIQHLQRGLGVEREMEMHCIAALLQLQQADAALGAGALEVVVAPMEADPQLAYLCAAGLCDAVLSDDSDLLAYSAACGCSFPIITKYDSRTHTAQVVDLAQSLLRDVNLHQQRSHNTPQQTLPQKSRAKLDFLQQVRTQLLLSFTSPRGASSAGAAQSPAPRGTVLSRSGSGNRMFVQLCILAGCDYADSIPSVGLMTALQVAKNADDAPCFLSPHLALLLLMLVPLLLKLMLMHLLFSTTNIPEFCILISLIVCV